MPRGSKEKYTDKQKRMAGHIEESYEQNGVSEDEAERRAWATVNKETGGGEKPGSGGSGTHKSMVKLLLLMDPADRLSSCSNSGRD